MEASHGGVDPLPHDAQPTVPGLLDVHLPPRELPGHGVERAKVGDLVVLGDLAALPAADEINPPTFGPPFSSDGTLYVQRFKDQSPGTTADLYRMDGLTATLVAHLPSSASGIDAHGTDLGVKEGRLSDAKRRGHDDPCVEACDPRDGGPLTAAYARPATLPSTAPVRVP